MKKIGLLFSHNLTKEQYESIEQLGILEIVKLPKELQEIWSNVDPYEKGRVGLDRVKDFISKELEAGDCIIIQGEWGYTYEMVNWSKEKGYIPVYSATKRMYDSELAEDGTVKNVHYFKHVCFKEY